MNTNRRKTIGALAAAGLGVNFGVLGMGQKPTVPNKVKPAEWLVLYYMNGKNNLVKFALEDFLEMSKVGSSESVSIVAQVGRPARGNPPLYGQWSGVKRYYIQHDAKPTTEAALMHVGNANDEAGDMGSPDTLEKFIAWGTSTFPAKRKMLVIWNHGQGWRFQAHRSDARFAAASRALTPDERESMRDARVIGSYRSVSSDDDRGSILYNKQLQTVLEQQAAKGARFDIVAYDACLMSMVETAYSLRRCTDILIGSQELEPGAGWDHTIMLKKLSSQPGMTPEQLSDAVVRSYRERYGDDDMTTLSATRLGNVQTACQSISSLATALSNSAQQSFPVLTRVRSTLKAFADYDNIGYAVDCETFLERLAATSSTTTVKASATEAAKAVKALNISNYASKQMADYSPRGLALYFPQTKADFMRDPDRDGYLRTNTLHPVDFVNDMNWSLLLKEYLGLG